MRHLPNGSLLIDELAIVVVLPHEGPPALLLTGTGDPNDAGRVIHARRGAELNLVREALLLLGLPVMLGDASGAQSASSPEDDL